MSTPDALRLADALTAPKLPDWVMHMPAKWSPRQEDVAAAATELRRQHAEIELLRDELNLCCALKREYQQQAAGGIERRHAEIERLTGINSDLCRKTNALTIQSARDAEEIERLRADAARYRRLRDTECSIDVFGNACALTMDSAIDAAMRDAPNV